jgi:hypothetical protein
VPKWTLLFTEKKGVICGNLRLIQTFIKWFTAHHHFSKSKWAESKNNREHFKEKAIGFGKSRYD